MKKKKSENHRKVFGSLLSEGREKKLSQNQVGGLL